MARATSGRLDGRRGLHSQGEEAVLVCARSWARVYALYTFAADAVVLGDGTWRRKGFHSLRSEVEVLGPLAPVAAADSAICEYAMLAWERLRMHPDSIKSAVEGRELERNLT